MLRSTPFVQSTGKSMTETEIEQFKQRLLTLKTELETDHRRATQLTAVEGALRRIESDDFGFCFKCDDEIDLRRLNVDPTITRCLKCKDH